MRITLSLSVFLSIHSSLLLTILNGKVVDAQNTLKCLDSVDYNKDYFPDKVVPKFSKNWSITYHNTYKILTVKANNLNESEPTTESYLLYQCGTTPPESEVGKHKFSIQVPLQDELVLTETNQIPHIEQLGLRRRIKYWNEWYSPGYTDHYITSPCANLLLDENVIEYIPEDVDIKTVLTNDQETVILKSAPHETDSDINQHVLVISEKLEGSVKAIYEWHKVYGALYNSEALANEQFDASVARYDCVANAADEIVNETLTKPKVLWAAYVSYTKWDGAEVAYWDIAESCSGSDPEFYCELATSCGAEIVPYQQGSLDYYGDFHMTDDEFFEFGKDADYFIYTGYNWDEENGPMYLFQERLNTFKSVQNGHVYDILKSGTGSYFEQRIAEYDLLLEDFCNVVEHTNDGPEPYERSFFRKVLNPNAEEIGSPGICSLEDVDKLWVSRATECGSSDDDDDENSGRIDWGYDVVFRFVLVSSSMVALLVLV